MNVNNTEKSRASLLALDAIAHPTTTLRRALTMARRLGTELHVVRVVPDVARVNVLFPQRNLADTFVALESLQRSVRSTRSWLIDVSGDETLADRLAVVRGDFIERVAGRSYSLAARTIFLSPRMPRLGALTVDLATASAVPVTVLRKSGEDEILAATSLSDSGYPVLTRAARVGDTMRVPMVALHHVDAGSPIFFEPVAHSTDEVGIPAMLSTAEQELHEVVSRFSTTGEPVVTRGSDAGRAILEQARARRTNLLVVGSRRLSFMDRLLGGTVATDVVEKATRSVMVEPL